MKAVVDPNVLLQELGFVFQVASKSVDKVLLSFNGDMLSVGGVSKNVSFSTSIVLQEKVEKDCKCIVEFSKLYSVVKQLFKTKSEVFVLCKNKDNEFVIQAGKNKITIPTYNEKYSSVDDQVKGGSFIGTVDIAKLGSIVSNITHLCNSSASSVFPALASINIVPNSLGLTFYTTDKFVMCKQELDFVEPNSEQEVFDDILVPANHFIIPKINVDTLVDIYVFSSQNIPISIGLSINNNNTFIKYALSNAKALPCQQLFDKIKNSNGFNINVGDKDLRFIANSIKQFDTVDNKVVNINVGATEIEFLTKNTRFAVERIVTEETNTCSISLDKGVFRNFIQSLSTGKTVSIKVCDNTMLYYVNDDLGVVSSVISIQDY